MHFVDRVDFENDPLKMIIQGREPGLLVMGGDSDPEGRGFESQHCRLDGHFSLTFVVQL